MDDLSGLWERVEKSVSQSSLGKFMAENHDDFLETFSGYQRGRWAAVVVFAEENGLTDNNGKVPSEATAKQTWKRVKARVARVRAARATLATTIKPVAPLSPARPAPLRRRFADLEDDTPLPEPNYFKPLI